MKTSPKVRAFSFVSFSTDSVNKKGVKLPTITERNPVAKAVLEVVKDSKSSSLAEIAAGFTAEYSRANDSRLPKATEFTTNLSSYVLGYVRYLVANNYLEVAADKKA